MSAKFADPLGFGTTASLVLVLAGEILFLALLVVGAYPSCAALGAAITMGVAFFLVHGGQLQGPENGEISFRYLAPFLALLIAGGGRFWLDAKLGAKV